MYQIEIRHDGLNKYRVIKGTEKAVLEQKARVQAAAWNEMWAKHVDKTGKLLNKNAKKEIAIEQTAHAIQEISACEKLLSDALRTNSAIDFWNLKLDTPYSETEPQISYPRELPTEPQEDDAEFAASLNLFDKLISSRAERKKLEARGRFVSQHSTWEQECNRRRQMWATDDAQLEKDVHDWKLSKIKFETARKMANDTVDEFQRLYEDGDRNATLEYCKLVLGRSKYPNDFPREFEIELFDSGVCVVDYRLPCLSDLPRLKEVKYTASRDSLDEVYLKDAAVNTLYDSVVYQICLRTIHELFSADSIGTLKAIAFNGWVNYTNPATGTETQACIISVQADREEFDKLNLGSVEPKSCFRSLKGVGSSQLHAMAPVKPLISLNRQDARFVASVDIEASLKEGANLAAIGWEEFEHLIRQLFEKEFSTNGGEVKVTQASRDGGVDAIAFDPDPIRGGKIVIQAKRYTNTVDVSAVRDLYGTVMNEGATKGILVTTSNFGPDAYKFAKDKPLTLLDGGNLLYLMSKHGYQVHIDLKEAKALGLSMQR